MIWDVRSGKFARAYDELQDYYDEYGNLDIKAKYVSPSGINLGKWVNLSRNAVKKHGIDAVFDKKQQEQLNKLGMIWDKNPDSSGMILDENRISMLDSIGMNWK